MKVVFAVQYEAALLLVSTKNRDLWPAPGLIQHRKSAIHGLPVTMRMLRAKSDKSYWFWSQSIYKAIQNWNVVGLGQRSRFLVLTKRSAASGDENVTQAAWLVRSEHAHASYPGLFFRSPEFSPYKRREERRVQRLDY